MLYANIQYICTNNFKNTFMSVLVVGTVAFDAIETPFGKTDKILGGAGTYISLAASYFTKNINMVSVVGDDFPKANIEMLQAHQVNTDGVQVIAGEKTFFWSNIAIFRVVFG